MATEVRRVLKGQRIGAERERLALRVVYEAARALAELRHRLEATAVEIDGELPLVERSLARVVSALSQLSGAVEELEAVAEHVADALTD